MRNIEVIMENGIICFETGDFKKYNTTNEFYALPLLEFMKNEMGIEFIYRQVATRQELEFYLKKIGDKHFKNKYNVVYFSFHGRPENIFLTHDERSNVSLDDLAEMGAPYESFLDQHIHFSSCETLDCDDSLIKTFKRNVGAKTVSGYTKCVNTTPAFINEFAYFHQIFTFNTLTTIKKHMENYDVQLSKLGFKII